MTGPEPEPSGQRQRYRGTRSLLQGFMQLFSGLSGEDWAPDWHWSIVDDIEAGLLATCKLQQRYLATSERVATSTWPPAFRFVPGFSRSIRAIQVVNSYGAQFPVSGAACTTTFTQASNKAAVGEGLPEHACKMNLKF